MAVLVALRRDVPPQFVLVMGFEVREEKERSVAVPFDEVDHHVGQRVHPIPVERDALARFVVHEPLVRL